MVSGHFWRFFGFSTFVLKSLLRPSVRNSLLRLYSKFRTRGRYSDFSTKVENPKSSKVPKIHPSTVRTDFLRVSRSETGSLVLLTLLIVCKTTVSVDLNKAVSRDLEGFATKAQNGSKSVHRWNFIFETCQDGSELASNRFWGHKDGVWINFCYWRTCPPPRSKESRFCAQ